MFWSGIYPVEIGRSGCNSVSYSLRVPAAGRVLIVDDEPGIVRVVSRFLAGEGYAVDEAGDGVTGLAMALAHTYDTILLDLVLPGLEGSQVLRRLRQTKPSQPVVIISSTADRALTEDCLRLGATLLAKPFTLMELLAIVRSTSLARPATPL